MTDEYPTPPHGVQTQKELDLHKRPGGIALLQQHTGDFVTLFGGSYLNLPEDIEDTYVHSFLSTEQFGQLIDDIKSGVVKIDPSTVDDEHEIASHQFFVNEIIEDGEVVSVESLRDDEIFNLLKILEQEINSVTTQVIMYDQLLSGVVDKAENGNDEAERSRAMSGIKVYLDISKETVERGKNQLAGINGMILTLGDKLTSEEITKYISQLRIMDAVNNTLTAKVTEFDNLVKKAEKLSSSSEQPMNSV
jgi:hypothetical protein